jgi:hypothetical protein
MVRFAALTLLSLTLTVGTASAQWVIVNSPPPVVTYEAPPVIVHSPPVVTYSAPITYSAPVVTHSYYYPPATTVYSAPVVASPVIPGTVTTRSYVGLGIFRPRGVYTQSYFTPWR